VINIVLLILSVTHGISAADKGWISSAVLVGALVGQIGFGIIADKVPLSLRQVLTPSFPDWCMCVCVLLR
jgi:MFS family permease